MRTRDFTDLLLLAAIWGASFLFTRMAVGEFGPFALMELRVGLAALCLIPFVVMSGKLPQLLKHWRALLITGTLNAAIPFTLYAFAAQSLGAGFLSVSNAVTPAWGGIIAWLWLKDRLPWLSSLGLAVGFSGIVVLVWDKLEFSAGGTGPATLAAILAPMSYGVAANFAKRFLTGVDPVVNAGGSMLGAATLLMPFAIYTWPTSSISFQAWAATLLLAVLCTGVAYLMFFRLLASLGPTRTVTVTFLVPVFGVFWGAFLLDEVVTLRMAAGAGVVLFGSALVIGGGRKVKRSK